MSSMFSGQQEPERKKKKMDVIFLSTFFSPTYEPRAIGSYFFKLRGLRGVLGVSPPWKNVDPLFFRLLRASRFLCFSLLRRSAASRFFITFCMWRMHHSDKLLAAKFTEDNSLQLSMTFFTSLCLSSDSGCFGLRSKSRSAIKKNGSISRAATFFLWRFFACFTFRLISSWTGGDVEKTGQCIYFF